MMSPAVRPVARSSASHRRRECGSMKREDRGHLILNLLRHATDGRRPDIRSGNHRFLQTTGVGIDYLSSRPLTPTSTKPPS